MYIMSNISALNASNNLRVKMNNKSKSMEKLSSGLRINRAVDDAAGLAISEKMRMQIKGLQQASRNIQDGISLIQTAEGAMQEIHAMLQRMNTLANQSANGTYSQSDRASMQAEFEQLQDEIDSIAGSTNFNGISLLDGSFLRKLQIGDTANDFLDININDLSKDKLFGTANETLGITGGNATLNVENGDYNVTITKNIDGDFNIHVQGWVFDLGRVVLPTESSMSVNYVDGGLHTLTFNFDYASLQEGTLKATVNNGAVTIYQPSNISVISQSAAQASIQTIKSAVDTISTERARLGAYQNRLEHTQNNVLNYAENLTAAESRIRDTDMAKEMIQLTKNQILMEAGQAMLAQANAQPQGVLRLLV